VLSVSCINLTAWLLQITANATQFTMLQRMVNATMYTLQLRSHLVGIIQNFRLSQGWKKS